MVSSDVSVWSLVLLAFVSPGKAAACSRPNLEGNVVLTDEAILKNDFPNESKVTIECAVGYEVEHGSDTVTCTDGTWSDPELICKKKDCGPPPPKPNLTYDMPHGTLFGAYITPVCDEGYYLQGSSHRQCLPFGWGGTSNCELITCEEPTEIPNGMITERPERKLPLLADVIVYSCNANYKLVGNRSISCEEDGEYSSEPPKCIPIECEAPEIQFGVQIAGESHYAHKSEATFQCQPGYRMEGSPKIVCEENGWSEYPVCRKDIKTETTQETTEFTPTTTSIIISTTEPEELGQFFSSVNTPGPPTNTADIPYTAAVFAVFSIFVAFGCCIGCIVHHHLKRKGSYDTGEALKTKEELLQKRSPNLTPV